MAYKVVITPAAKRDIASLDKAVQQRVKTVIDRLAEEPRPFGVVKLAGEKDAYRIRVGDYRVIYDIRDKKLLVLVIEVGHRGDIYR